MHQCCNYNETNMIPENFESWKNCIVNDCKIQLTPEFVKTRLDVFNDASNPETKKFIECYGVLHLKNIISWYQKIENNG